MKSQIPVKCLGKKRAGIAEELLGYIDEGTGYFTEPEKYLKCMMGAVATFQDVKVLQDSEQKIRIKLHQKGLFAKYHFEDIIGNSYRIQENISHAKKFAKSDATILIQGETGTGKELFAQSIHNESQRAGMPFVAVNCGSLPRNLLEAELFGYVEGAFTGGGKGGKMGLFEMAHGGTIFLDEIGEMPLETQVQLLRVLQEKEIRRIGSDRVTPVNIRVITATNRDLYYEIQKKRFREDLYYRLNVLNMMERAYVLLSQKEEHLFVEHYIQSYLRMEGQGKDTNETSIAKHHDWQDGETENLEGWEKDNILRALKEHHLEIAKTAEALGISRSTLWRKIKKYKIQTKQFEMRKTK